MPDRRFPAIRLRLLGARDELLRRSMHLHDHQLRATGPLSADFAEQAVESGNDQVVDRLSELTASELSAIDAALRRLSDGSYGLCVSCGAAIEPARLEALPQVAECLRCATAAEIPA